MHHVIDVVWTELTEAFDWSEPPAWYVILVPGLAGLLVAAALRLPGHGGHSPLEGLGMGEVAPIDLPGILLAALATLGLGLVLGARGAAHRSRARSRSAGPPARPARRNGSTAPGPRGCVRGRRGALRRPAHSGIPHVRARRSGGSHPGAGDRTRSAPRLRRRRLRRARVHRDRRLAGSASGPPSRFRRSPITSP
jgi:hypothetical protein